MADGNTPKLGNTFLGATISEPEQFANNIAKIMEHMAQIATLLADKAEKSSIGTDTEDNKFQREDAGAEIGRAPSSAAPTPSRRGDSAGLSRRSMTTVSPCSRRKSSA